MIVLFSLLILTPKHYHDTLFLGAGISHSHFLYEADIYPTIKAIDYQGFVHE